MSPLPRLVSRSSHLPGRLLAVLDWATSPGGQRAARVAAETWRVRAAALAHLGALGTGATTTGRAALHGDLGAPVVGAVVGVVGPHPAAALFAAAVTGWTATTAASHGVLVQARTGRRTGTPSDGVDPLTGAPAGDDSAGPGPA